MNIGVYIYIYRERERFVEVSLQGARLRGACAARPDAMATKYMKVNISLDRSGHGPSLTTD